MTVEIFKNALQATGGRDFGHVEYLRVFRTAFPQLRSEDDHGLSTCRRLLDEMKAAKLIRFPASGSFKSYYQMTFPEVISLTAARREKLVRPTIEWDGRLAFQASKANERALADLMKMNAFLQGMKVAPTRLAPINARSLEIFGEEKRLKSKVVCQKTGRIFDNLTLADFNCYLPNEYYLTYTPYPSASTTALIVENSETFHIMKRLNLSKHRDHRYRAVIHGRGKEILKGFQCLPEIAAELGLTRFEYFGDIDVPGFEMPIKASASLADISAFRIEPALDLYATCLLIGKPYEASYSPDYDPMKSWQVLRQSACEWLAGDVSLYPTIAVVLESGKRVAQEWIY